MRVIVTGGRNYLAGTKVFDTLKGIGPTAVIQGGASGADSLARNWAHNNNIQVITYEYRDAAGRGGGPVRNKFMVEDARADLVVAFPGGRGTANCVHQARIHGIEVREIT